MTPVRSGEDLVFKLSNGTDQVTVKDWFADSTGRYQIERVEFADGAVWTGAQVNAVALEVIGTADADSLTGVSAFADTLRGADGNDTLRAVGSGDLLDGGTGDDNLGITGTPNISGTTYIGGTGNDTITGASYNDIYLFNLGDGEDTITDSNGSYVGYTDVLRFGAGIVAADVTPLRSGEDLIFKLSNGTDQVTFKNWFTDSTGRYQIERVEFTDGTVWTGSQVHAAALEVFGTAGADALTGVVAFADTLHGADGNDTLRAVGNNDLLDGGAGNDNLGISGSAAVSGTTYIGGAGNDTINGAAYNDIYVFNLGDGQDTVTEYNLNSIGYNDVLRFGAGIAPANVTPMRSGEDLIFKLSNGTDQVTFKNWFTSTNYQLERVEFADGTMWTGAQVNSQAGTVSGTEAADTLTGGTGLVDTLQGLGGNDTLRAVGNNDLLDGGAGDDNLGFSGSAAISGTTYIGGTGNDTINGAAYNDIYVFNLGDGQDTITEYNLNSIYNDVLRFGSDISAAEVTPVRSGEDLIFKVSNGTDQVMFKNWFTHSNYQVERVEFADGTLWTGAQVNAVALEVLGTSGADSLTGVAAFADTLRGAGGNDTLRAVGNNDLLDGGAGDDNLGITGSVNVTGTTYIGGTGNDTINGGSYNDTYVFNLGDGQDTVTEYNLGSIYTDILRFGAGIAASNVTPVRSGEDLTFRLSNGTDQVTFKNWFTSTNYQAERVEFADGTVWTSAQVNAAALEVFGTSGADSLTGVAAFADTLRGAGGNDTLRAVGNNDLLDGGAGDDNLGITGSLAVSGTTYMGGTGNDTINGAAYNDIYLFNLGDGKDTVSEYNTSASYTDVLRFGAGIAVADITPVRVGADLILKHANGTDEVAITNWFTSTNYQIERIEFADSTVWLNTAVNAKFNAITGTAAAESMTGLSDRYNTMSALDGADTLNGANSHDRLDGGLGADTMAGKAGNDTYVVDNAGDIVTELFGEGVDFVESSVTYALPTEVEHLKLTGATALNGIGNSSNNVLVGNTGNNLLSAGAGSDSVYGGSGNDLLEGGADADVLSDNIGAGYFNGGAGDDSISGGASAEIFIAGSGNDAINTGNGADIVVFNRGDGADAVSGGVGTDNTISLGGGIRYADLSFRKSNDDLILDVGSAESVTFKDWYVASASNKSVSKLQVILEATTDYDAGSADATLNKKVEQFDFAGLAGEFDQALAATPGLTSWALSNALSTYYLAGSDTAALGGDLAYYYGKNGNVTGMSASAAQDVIGSASLGTANQTLRAFAGISGGPSTLG